MRLYLNKVYQQKYVICFTVNISIQIFIPPIMKPQDSSH